MIRGRVRKGYNQLGFADCTVSLVSAKTGFGVHRLFAVRGPVEAPARQDDPVAPGLKLGKEPRFDSAPTIPFPPPHSRTSFGGARPRAAIC